jgi:hypothetical protein
MRNTIKRLKETLPPLLTVQEYCRLMSRCQASAYHDLKNKPGIAVKVGGSTRFVTDAVLDEMLRLPAWVPQKDRVRTAGAKVTTPNKSTRPRREHTKKTAAPRRERDPEARA